MQDTPDVTSADGRLSAVPPSPEQPGQAAPDLGSRQASLFPEMRETQPEDVGYRGTTAHQAAGITYRQLDYWARTGLVEPSVRGAHGSGSARLYSFRDICVLRVVKKLLDAGVSLQNVRAAVEHLRASGVDDLSSITLISDGSTVYECTSNDEVIDLVQGGQAVFAVAVGRTLLEVEGTLAHLPGERYEGGTVAPVAAASDELASRRARRQTG